MATNKIIVEKQASVVAAHVKGNSIRSVERMNGIQHDAIVRLGMGVRDTCKCSKDETTVSFLCKRIQVDENWCNAGKQQIQTAKDNPSEFADFRKRVSIDAETKSIPSFTIRKRDNADAKLFIGDFSTRVKNRVQISSDALRTYVEVIDVSLGSAVE